MLKLNVTRTPAIVNLRLSRYLFFQYKGNIGPVGGRSSAVNGLFDQPSVVKIFIHKSDFVSGMTVSYCLLVHINVYRNYFLGHDVYVGLIKDI